MHEALQRRTIGEMYAFVCKTQSYSPFSSGQDSDVIRNKRRKSGTIR